MAIYIYIRIIYIYILYNRVELSIGGITPRCTFVMIFCPRSRRTSAGSSFLDPCGWGCHRPASVHAFVSPPLRSSASMVFQDQYYVFVFDCLRCDEAYLQYQWAVVPVYGCYNHGYTHVIPIQTSSAPPNHPGIPWDWIYHIRSRPVEFGGKKASGSGVQNVGTFDLTLSSG